jgi:hypothetical protein
MYYTNISDLYREIYKTLKCCIFLNFLFQKSYLFCFYQIYIFMNTLLYIYIY